MTAREVRALEARVLDTLTVAPGLTRSELAARLGIEPAQLHRPVTNLLHAGRIVRDGHKSKTSYLPR